MKLNKGFLWLLLAFVLLLSGCNMRTIDELYCLPKRSEDYLTLKSVIDRAMVGLEYYAPVSGDNQQTVQTADLNGDEDPEYLVFARGIEDKKLRILIFTCVDDEYVLAETIERSANAFENVQYVPFTGGNGSDLVFGCQVSDQVVRWLSVYQMNGTNLSEVEPLRGVSYSRFVCADLDHDGLTELLVLRSDELSESPEGVAELFQMGNNGVERFKEAMMSQPVENIKRIMVSKLSGGANAVYVASDVGGSAIITDVFTVVDNEFVNVTHSNETGTIVETLRNYYVYAEDIDGDGTLELPSLIPMLSTSAGSQEEQYLIRWYAMRPSGNVIDKMYTYHNYMGGWYLVLNKKIVDNLMVDQRGNSYVFTIQKEDGSLAELMTVYVFTGYQREEQGVADNRFVLHRTETTVYAAHLSVESAAYNITKDSLIQSFCLIMQDWKPDQT